MYDELVHRAYFDVEWTRFYRRVSMQVLKVFKFPITCTQVQLGVGVVWALLMWATGLHKKPKVSKEQVICSSH
jgi:solute carrier family 35 protein E1